MQRLRQFAAVIALTGTAAAGGIPRDALPLDAGVWPRNFRLHVEGPASVRLAQEVTLTVPAGTPWDIAVEHPGNGAQLMRVWSGGKLMRGPEELPAAAAGGAQEFPAANLDLGSDYTAMVQFECKGEGTLYSMC